MKTLILTIAAVGLMAAAVALAEDEAANVIESDVAQLIQQLDSDEFDQREAAAAQLTKLGRAAIEPLTAAAQQESVEVRFRALNILKTLYASDDAAAKEAARKAWEALSQSDNVSIRRLAEKILTAPQYEIPAGIWRGEGSAHVFGGERPLVLEGDGGVTISGAGIRIGAKGQLILARAAGGVRRIDLIKGTGLGVLLLESEEGIEIHVRQPQEKGEAQFTRYVAKDADELADKHPKAHKLYTTLEVYQKNQTIIGGVAIEF